MKTAVDQAYRSGRSIMLPADITLIWFPGTLRLLFKNSLDRQWRRRHLIVKARMWGTLWLFFRLIHGGLRKHHDLIFVFCHLHIGIRDDVFWIVREDPWPGPWGFTIRDFLIAWVNTLNRHFRHAQSLCNIRFACHFIKHNLALVELIRLFIFYEVDVVVIEVWLVDILNRFFLLMKHLFNILLWCSIRTLNIQKMVMTLLVFGGPILEDLGGRPVHFDVVKLRIYSTWRSLYREHRPLLFLKTSTPCLCIFSGNFDQFFLVFVLIDVVERRVYATVHILSRSDLFAGIHLHRSLWPPMLIFGLIDGVFVDLPGYSRVSFVTCEIRLNCIEFSTFNFRQRRSIYYVWLDFRQKPLACSLFSWIRQITLIDSVVFFETR